MLQFEIEEVARITRAKWIQKASTAPIRFISIDSRRIDEPAETLFFALPGAQHDGHQFLQTAYQQGVRNFIVSQPQRNDDFPEANLLLVDQSLNALQQLAAHKRSLFDMPVVGITGSNGKTVVKEWLNQVCSPDFSVVRSPGSYNSQVGVPISVWAMDHQHALAIFEAGISQTGEMEKLEAIIKPTIGIFTNIGPAHASGFSDMAEKVAEKMRLFDHADVLIACADYDLIREATDRWLEDKQGRKRIMWSSKGEKDAIKVTFSTARQSTDIKVDRHTFTIPFVDPASCENAVNVWLTARELGVEAGPLVSRMAALGQVAMRLEMKNGINGCRLVNDAYSNDLSSLRIALQFTRRMDPQGKMTVVLTDILSHGADKPALYAEVAALLSGASINRLIGVGAEVKLLNAALPSSIEQVYYNDVESLLSDFEQLHFQNEVILLKGARVFALERLAQRLELKVHKTRLEVNLNALVHNLHVYTQKLLPGVKTMVMVKAAGYGSGPVEVARVLEYHKVDYLGVAYTDEGVELRQAGIKTPILVLNPDVASFETMVQFDLEPEIYSLSQLREWVAFADMRGSLRIHLKLDTGMHRLGFPEGDVPELTGLLQAHPTLHVSSIFSHLVASDDPAHDAFTHRQAEAFVRMYETIAAALGYRPLRHLMNTGGIARFPDYQFDMVRLGIGLYGVDGNQEVQQELQVVHTLKATISQIKEIEAGETVGYMRKGMLSRKSRIATISIGYADGLLRLAGNGRYSVQVRGKSAPLVGNICMDMSMIDLTDIPDASEGDEVVVFGAKPGIHELAEALQTIPYEVLTNISQRVKRVYFQES